MAELKKCPKCGGDNLRTVWTNGRMLQHMCEGPGPYDDTVDCDWVGEPFIPEKRPITGIRTVYVGSWCYEGFDQYGHTFCHSRGYNSEEEATEEARKEVEKMSKVPEYGKCTAVVWPPTTTVTGKLLVD